METDVASATCLVEGSLSMEDVVYIREHETPLQLGCYRSQELEKDPGAVSNPKGRIDLPLIDKEVPLRIPESKPRVAAMGWMNRYMQIGILEVQ